MEAEYRFGPLDGVKVENFTLPIKTVLSYTLLNPITKKVDVALYQAEMNPGDGDPAILLTLKREFAVDPAELNTDSQSED